MPNDTLTQDLFQELCRIPLIDPHSHIDPHHPVSKSLADILGYHYYTELAHSAGMPKHHLAANVDPREQVRAILSFMDRFDNTVQYSWFLDIARTFFGFEGTRITSNDADTLWDLAAKKLAQPDWENQVLQLSNLEKVFLTNEFDDPLEGFDLDRYIPCLRTDALVFQLEQPEIRQRLGQATKVEVGDIRTLRQALRTLFEHFTRHGARACAISLPPDFTPLAVSDAEVERILGSPAINDPGHRALRACGVFWLLAECCRDFGLPFDLMIGVNRRVYPGGVYQGQDLFDQRTSLIQYATLFNAFPGVVFPISVLTSVQNQELASYSWIFPNVVTHGHWWYSNVPVYIEHDTRARLQAVPKTKQIGYYSDMYKLEFGLPKFNTYRQILAHVLADQYVRPGAMTETEAVSLGRMLLRDNVCRIFKI
jgi:glucuronate isomerase